MISQISLWVLQILGCGIIISSTALGLHGLAKNYSLPNTFRYYFLKTAFLLMVMIPVVGLIASQMKTRSPHLGATFETKVKSATISVVEDPKGIVSKSVETIFFVYGVGLLISLAFLARSIFRANAIIRQAKQENDIGSVAAVYSSAAVRSPVSFGVLKPIILMPSHLLSSLDPEELQMVLAHEDTHISKKDHLYKALSLFVSQVWYFWPPVKGLAQELEAEMEFTCDRHLVDSGFFPPRAYGELLLRLSHFQTPNAGWSGLGISNSFLVRRIESMKNNQQKRRPLTQAALISLLGACGIGISAYAVQSPQLPLAGESAGVCYYKIEVKAVWGDQEQKGTLPSGQGASEMEVNKVKFISEIGGTGSSNRDLHVQIIAAKSGDMIEDFKTSFETDFEKKMNYSDSDIKKIELKLNCK